MPRKSHMQKGSNVDGTESEDLSSTNWEMAQQTYYDRDSNTDLTATIIQAIAEVKYVEPAEVTQPNLYDCVDAAAVEDSLFGPDVRGESRDVHGQVEFMYAEYRIVVQDDGWIFVHTPIEA